MVYRALHVYGTYILLRTYVYGTYILLRRRALQLSAIITQPVDITTHPIDM